MSGLPWKNPPSLSSPLPRPILEPLWLEPVENVFLQVWKDSLPNSGFIFLMSRFKSTRVSGNVIIRLGGRVMKNVIFANLGVPSHGPHGTL